MQDHEQEAVQIHESDHPTPFRYVQVAIILTLITAFEVAIYYVDALEDAFITIFIGLSAVKFLVVAMFYMHLKFDSRLFSALFVFGLALGAGILITLGVLFGIFTD